MKVFYTEKQNSEQGDQDFDADVIKSPSSRKPQQVAEALRGLEGIEFVEPSPLTRDDFKLCHDPAYIDGVMDLQRKNGFGTISQSVVDSLPYTNGAMYDAAKAATINSPTVALVSGFHHACYDGWEGRGYFCTFNGLMITAAKMIAEGTKHVAILDCDMHIGNGTDDILKHVAFADQVTHISFGYKFKRPEHCERYLQWLEPNGEVERRLLEKLPSVLLYQAGADVHIEDPYGGVLSTEQMIERDERVFSIAKRLGIPVAWNLAGGYQIGPNGEIDRVIELHLNTAKACQRIYGN